jgi:ABC-type Fe3+ transport system permease subunit
MLMSRLRKFASRLLEIVVRHSCVESQTWGRAMLRELDFVESDWAALRWALGSTGAVCRHSVLWRCETWIAQVRSLAQSQSKNVVRKAAEALSGAALAAVVLTLCVLALVALTRASGWQLALGCRAEPWLGFVLPETVYVVAAFVLWRRRRSAAIGVLATGVTLMTHVIVHVATHG